MNFDLKHKILTDANLRGFNLIGFNLRGFNLRGADLRGANLTEANLIAAILTDADLSDAYLIGANLRGAYLRGTDLRGAILRCADLRGADLTDANLRDADLTDACLRGADLRGAKGNLIEYRKGKILTDKIVGYKKCKAENGSEVIVKLEIPRGAIVFSINGNKCRTNKAKVIEIFEADRAYSLYKYMSYYIGDEFNIYDFNCEYNAECASGIHFYMTIDEASCN